MTSSALGTRLIAFGWAALLLAGALGAVAGAARGATGGMLGDTIRHSGPGHASSTSTNWAGWAVTGALKSVTDVKGSWIVPKIQGTCPSSSQYSSFWIGIDGYNSGSVEQTGTDSDCQSGSPVYYAWFEFYPHPSRLISSLAIHAGDTISAEVSYASGSFTVKITDVTTGHSFSKAKAMSAHRSSAEWIAEAPSSGGILPLANFGTVHFGHDATSVASTGFATVSGTTGAIGSFSSAVSIDMINTAGTKTKASTGPLTPNGSSFNVTWKSAGP